MSTFLKSKNNLYDLHDVEKAREHLGIGTLASQDSNNVFITGGSAALNEIVLSIPSVVIGSVVVATDSNGSMGFSNFSAQDWPNKDQNLVDISLFNNDSGFALSNTLASVAFTGNYSDLLGTPVYNVTGSEYLLKDRNLDDLPDKDTAKSNLGFGPFAFLDTTDQVSISNLLVTDNFHFSAASGADPNDYLNKYLKVSQVNGDTLTTEWSDLPIASGDGTLGLLRVSNNIDDQAQNTAPSSRLMYESFSNLASRIQTTNNADFILELISDTGLLDKRNDLSEFDTPASKSNARSNLGLGTLATYDRANVVIDNLTVNSDLRFGNNAFTNAYLKSTDALGTMAWGTLELASSSTKGAVYIQSDYTTAITDPTRAISTVPNAYALKTFKDDIETKVQKLENDIPTSIDQLEGVDQFMRLEEGLRNVDADRARINLQLSPVAWSGSFLDLNFKPTKLSDFVNTSYLDKRSNLADLVDKRDARSNLGLGDMALQDALSVNILGGNIECDHVTVNEYLQLSIPAGLTREASTPDLYLVAENNTGRIAWKGLTKATDEIYGAVRLVHDINVTTNIEDRVASATAVYRLFVEFTARLKSMEERIDKLLAA